MRRHHHLMYGAAIGDIWGSIYEHNNWKTANPEEIYVYNPACHFTDDTVLTAAIADAIYTYRRQLKEWKKKEWEKEDKGLISRWFRKNIKPTIDYKGALLRWARKYPNAGYGKGFQQWMNSKNPQPYNSFGNGSAMRVSPVGWLFDDEETVLEEAKRSAEPTHNHPEGIKGAQAVALAVFMARNGADKPEIKERIEKDFGYDLSRTLAEIRPTYEFDATCQGTVPVAIIAFLKSWHLRSAIQNAISVGGDSDTIAAIAGSIATAHAGRDSIYHIIGYDLDFAQQRLPDEIKQLFLANNN